MLKRTPHTARHGLISRLLAIAITVTGVSLPETAVVAADENESRYAVEIIVFRHNDQSRTTPEVAAGEFAPEGSVDRNPVPMQTNRRGTTPPSPLPAAELELQTTKEKLQRTNAYSVLLHLGWTQAATNRDKASPFWLRGPRARSHGLSGSLTLYKERFLHLAVDLDLAKPADNNGLSLRPPIVTRIQESRRIRTKLLQYFDNPEFGIIASVRRLDGD